MLRKSIIVAGIALALAGCKRTTSAPVSRSTAVVPVTLAGTRVRPVQRHVEAVGRLRHEGEKAFSGGGWFA